MVFTVNDRSNLIDDVAHELRRPVRIDPALDVRVMESVSRELRPGLAATLLRWLATPKPVRLSPAVTAAVAASIALAIWMLPAGISRPAGEVASSAASGFRLVEFSLKVPEASVVTVVGDFNDWDSVATPLEPSSAGDIWVVTVPLYPGRYQYTFLVDGEQWVADPGAPRALQSDFGCPSSVITVPEI